MVQLHEMVGILQSLESLGASHARGGLPIHLNDRAIEDVSHHAIHEFTQVQRGAMGLAYCRGYREQQGELSK